jgi:hypothetical protein
VPRTRAHVCVLVAVVVAMAATVVQLQLGVALGAAVVVVSVLLACLVRRCKSKRKAVTSTLPGRALVITGAS